MKKKNKGYYLITEKYEFWFENKSAAKDAQKEHGGSIVCANAADRKVSK